MSTETTTSVTVPTESEYKGKPTLILPPLNPKGQSFQFGTTKAKIILKHVKDIEAFVAKHEGKKSQDEQLKKAVEALRAKGSTDEEIKGVLGVDVLPC
jgi:hypothetical protein